MNRILVVVPTFKEREKIRSLLGCFSRISLAGVSLFVANGNPGDGTSELIRTAAANGLPVCEISGNSRLYWSGLTNIGIDRALQEGSLDDFILLMNADVTFTTNVFSSLREAAQRLKPCLIGAVTHSAGRVISSGAAVRSWCLAINRHPFAGRKITEIPKDEMVEVDFLPGRCTLIPLAAVRKGGRVNEGLLPHYTGDYEFSNRLKKAGYPAFIYTGVNVECDAGNTGNSVYHKSINFSKRVSSLLSIKTPDNPVYRTRYICAVYPLYARPTATVVYLFKSFLGVLLGGERIRKILPQNETALAGSAHSAR